MTLKNLPSYTGTPCSGVLNNFTIRYISNCLSVCLAIRQSVCQFVCVCLSVCPCVPICPSLSVCLSGSPPFCLLVCTPVSQSVSLTFCLFVSLTISQFTSIYMYCICLHVSICLPSVFLSIVL